MRRVNRLAVFVYSMLVLGCASSAGGGGSDSPRDALTQADLLETNQPTVYEALQQLRPQWMRVRGPGRAYGTPTIQVYLDGAPFGELNALRQLRVTGVRDVRYLSATDAATLFGTLSDAAHAILVRTR